jgi:hypothetical protein
MILFYDLKLAKFQMCQENYGSQISVDFSLFLTQVSQDLKS